MGTGEGAAHARAEGAKDYLVNTRGLKAERLSTRDGVCLTDLML